MTTQEADTTALAKEFELGVLLVHGIGTRPGIRRYVGSLGRHALENYRAGNAVPKGG